MSQHFTYLDLRNQIFPEVISHIKSIKSEAIGSDESISKPSRKLGHRHRRSSEVLRVYTSLPSIVFIIRDDNTIHPEFNMRFNDNYPGIYAFNSIPNPIIVTVNVNRKYVNFAFKTRFPYDLIYICSFHHRLLEFRGVQARIGMPFIESFTFLDLLEIFVYK